MKSGRENDLSRWRRRLGEWAEWDREQQSGMLGYPPTCEIRKGSGRPPGTIVPLVSARDRDGLAVARALARLDGWKGFSWGTIFAWLVEVSVGASQGPAGLCDRVRAAMDREPELRDQAAALLLRQWYLNRGATPGWWAAELGVSVTQMRALHDAALARFGEVLEDRESEMRPGAGGITRLWADTVESGAAVA